MTSWPPGLIVVIQWVSNGSPRCHRRGSTPDSCSVSLLTSLNARSWTGYKQPGLGTLLALAFICSAHPGTHVSPADIQDVTILEWRRCQVEHGFPHLRKLPQPAPRNPTALHSQLLRRPPIP